ncbi:MAG: hypothetical protein ACTHJ9_00615 [Rhodanobacter sp.]
MIEREDLIEGICKRTGKTREQAEAFMAVLGSAFARRGWAEGEPLSEEVVEEKFGVFLGEDS